MAPRARTTAPPRAALSWTAVVVKRVVFLVLGAIILAPYVALTLWLLQLSTLTNAPIAALSLLTVVVIAIGATPAFLPAMRYVERATARALLGAPLDRLDDHGGVSTIWRGAVYYCLHLVSGGLAAFGLIFALPVSVLVAIDVFTGSMKATVDASVALFPFLDQTTASILALGASAASLLAVITVTIVFPTIASRLLGPSAADRQAMANVLAAESARRNQLARELHDSVGHALTITTVQAAAAKRMLERDPESVRKSLTAIEDAGRTALEELDYVLGVLRSPADTAPAAFERQARHERTLADLRGLIAEMSAIGLIVDLTVAGDLHTVPVSVSRACFRILQEAFTNVLHHAGEVGVSVSIVVSADEFLLTMRNPLPPVPRPPHRGGRGVAGIRERALLLGGIVTARADDGEWMLDARIPLAAASA